MSNVVIFCRVSTKVQDYQRQVNDLTAFAQTRSWTIEKCFCEKVSGAASKSKRKELLAMLEYVRENKIDRVLVTELSRLGRDTLQVLEVINELNRIGVSLYIQNYNIETLTTEGKVNAMSQFLITILAEVAKMERRSIRERMESGYADTLFLVEYAEEMRLNSQEKDTPMVTAATA